MSTPSAPRRTRPVRSLRPLRPDDVRGVVVVEELDVLPDGSAAVVVRRVVRDGCYHRHLWLVDSVGRSAPRRLTSGAVRDGWPRCRPTVEPSRSYVPTRSTTTHRASCARWRSWTEVCDASRRRATASARSTSSPGRRRVPGSRSVCAVDPQRFVVGDRPPIGSAGACLSERLLPAANVPRADWRWDEIGHRDHWSHLFVLEVGPAGRAAGLPRQVTCGDWGVERIAWHPDGRTVAFAAAIDDDADLAPFTKIWAVDVDAGPRSKRSRPWMVLDAAGGATRPAWSPDGRWIAAVGVLEPWPFDDASPGMLLAPAERACPRRRVPCRPSSIARCRAWPAPI